MQRTYKDGGVLIPVVDMIPEVTVSVLFKPVCSRSPGRLDAGDGVLRERIRADKHDGHQQGQKPYGEYLLEVL